MKVYKNINIKGALLQKGQLNEYMKKIGSEHIVTINSSQNTYPIPKLKENFEFIEKTYKLLSNHLKLGIKIHSAGEWILDNFYIIEECEKNIIKNLTLKQYKKFPGILSGRYKGFARIYVLASEIVGFTDCKISEEILKETLKSYQSSKPLSMNEIWNIGIFIQIALIQNIRDICEKIYNAELQKYKVENIFERLVENKDEKDLVFKKQESTKEIFSYKELKYPFIEYMLYKLRRIGKNGEKYIQVLEEEVKKTGNTTSEIVIREHFYIANMKVSIGNCITSLKKISRINFQEIFENVNKTEEILEKDPSNVFSKMTQESKNYYRNIIRKISAKTRISEIYIAQTLIELSKENIKDETKSHIGYYLIGEGKDELIYNLTQKKKKKFIITPKLYINLFFILTILIDFIFVSFIKIKLIYKILSFIFLLIPISEIYIRIMNYILGKIIKPKLIPKIEFNKEIPEKASTLVTITTILDSKEKINKLVEKLEVYYIANKLENIYFAVLGDCTTSDRQKEEIDNEIIEYGREKIKQLNLKYLNKNIFHILYRKRRWNSSEKKFLGWERKRGLLNQLNKYLLYNDNSDFILNTLEETKFNKKIKYVITLDSDTNLTLDTAKEMIGAMEHPLNSPKIENGIVKKGYAIMQPSVGIELKNYRKSLFCEIFSGVPGIDFYSFAISNLYQDGFSEGIFTGKGIYNVKIYDEVLNSEIPENKVLSHDLLEGSYLRCGLLNDVKIFDDYPSNFLSYLERENRWIRGDWQIISWLKNKKINNLSKFKIFDNLRRSLLSVFSLILIFLSIILNNIPIMIVAIFSTIIINFLEILNNIIYKKSTMSETINAHKKFNNEITGIMGALSRIILDIIFIPTYCYNSIKAISKTIYRLKNNTKLLEWKTSEASEKESKNNIEKYCKKMYFSIVIGSLTFGLLNPFGEVLATLWVLAPFIAFYISKEKKIKNKINLEDQQYLLDIAKRTWKYFEDTIIKENNYFPSDNYQENRKTSFINSTSSTNIALGIMATLSAYDLKIISKEKCIELIKNIIEEIESLDKWNGHLYNWYNIKTKKPLFPRYISTVDSGNFIGYMYVLKGFINKEIKNDEFEKRIEKIINNTDFTKLYSPKNRLFSIGFNVEENKLTDSYYDFLASEARQASFVAIAKHDISPKHWNNLSRVLTSKDGYKGLISWSGTAFEYLMPNMNMKNYKGSLLDESSRFLIMLQKKYAKKNNIPWGISESAFNLKDLNSNYQYKAFGIPYLGLKRGLEDDLVVSPYSCFLALNYEPENVILNLKRLEKYGIKSKYGFYESIDFTRERLKKNEKFSTVKTYMAHHQALILLSINNYINNNILQERFYQNPEIKSIDILLNERMPNNIVLRKNINNRIKKAKYINDFSDVEIKYDTKEELRRVNVISSKDYTIYIDNKGQGYSKYKNYMINRFKKTDDKFQGIGFYVKNIKDNKIWSTFEKNDVKFMQSQDQIIKKFPNIELDMKIAIDSKTPAEIRRLKIKNTGTREEILEITSFIEAIISEKLQDYAHPIFNNMALRFEYIQENETFIIERKLRNTNEKLYLGVKLNLDKFIGKMEYEINKENFIGRNNNKIPKAVINSDELSSIIKDTIEPILAIRKTIKLKPKEESYSDLIIAVSENKAKAIKRIKELSNKNEIANLFNLAKAKTDEELKYLEVNSDNLITYQKLLGHLINQNIIDLKTKNPSRYNIEDIWKYGISGENPLILVKIKTIEDLYVIDELLSCIEFYNTRNTRVDLCILNQEELSYNTILRDGINESVRNHLMEYLLNNQIYIIDEKKSNKSDIEALESKSKIILKAKNGGIKVNLEELEKNIVKINSKKIESNQIIQETKPNQLIKMENLNFYNGIGGFSEDKYIIEITKDIKPPRAWANVISNNNFGTILTDNFGGYTWYKNSRLQRITRWTNDLITDIPSEMIFAKEDEKVWSIGNRLKTDQNYYVTHGMGYSKFSQMENDILQEIIVFVPENYNTKIIKLRLKNLISKTRNLELFYSLNLVLGEDEYKTLGQIFTKKIDNKIVIENLCKSEFNEKIYITSNKTINKYTNNKEEFIGENINNPVGIYQENWKYNDGISYGNNVTINVSQKLESFEEAEIIFTLSAEEKEIIDKENVNKLLSNVEKSWYEKSNILKVKTPSKQMNTLLNNWIVYQTLSSRIYAKSGLYQSGGAIGFRDQLQDTLGMKFIDINLLKNQIIICSKHQFKEGDVLHWWHDLTQRGIRTKFSDDLLWLVYAVIEYVEYTGDYEFLETKIPYLEGEKLKENEDERYDIYKLGDEEESIFNHCIRAIEKSLNFGEHGLPKIGSGDWNDGFSNVGNKGKGESVWLGFFLYDILNRFEDILLYKKEQKYLEKYKLIKEDLKRKLNKNGWDGMWFKRAFTDDGKTIGSIENTECKIDSITQSWSVISGAADNDKKYHSLNSLENNLIDKQNGIIKLLTPAFTGHELDPGYIKNYLEGVRENGGQYTHAAIWVIIAYCILGNGNKATDLYEMINPINHSDTIEKVLRYKIEPYVIPADIYTNKDMTGRGGWSWYTGSSSWFYKAGIEYILGFKIEKGYININPCIKNDWKEYEIRYRYKTSIYNIKVLNPDQKNNSENIIVKVNGIIQKNRKIKINNDGKIYNIEIKM